MRIYIKAGEKYYRADVTSAWARSHNNDALVSCGLTAGEDGFTDKMLQGLIRREEAIPVSRMEYQHSGCLSSCRERGGSICRW